MCYLFFDCFKIFSKVREVRVTCTNERFGLNNVLQEQRVALLADIHQFQGYLVGFIPFECPQT